MFAFRLSFLIVIILTFEMRHINTLRIPRDTDSTATGTTEQTSITETLLTTANSNSETSSSIPSSSTPAPVLRSPSAEAFSRLFNSLNSTLGHVNTLIFETMKTASEQKAKDFERIGNLVQNVQAFLIHQSLNFSHDASSQLEKSLGQIQTFFRENQNQMKKRFEKRNSTVITNETISSKSNSSDVDLKEKIDNSTTTDPNTKSHEIDTPAGVNISTGIENTSGRGRTGLMGNFMLISSKMGQGLATTFRQAENTVTNSANQIQSQIQSFLNGTNDLLFNVGNAFQLPNLFNLTLPQTQNN